MKNLIQTKCDLCNETGKFSRNNNAAPYEGRCCNRCNYRIVIPKRFELSRIAMRGER